MIGEERGCKEILAGETAEVIMELSEKRLTVCVRQTRWNNVRKERKKERKKERSSSVRSNR